MNSVGFSRRAVLAGGASAALMAGLPRAQAADGKIRFLTSWFAEAEHGGFYQAKATGLYKAAGLDVEIQMGGPQVNMMQLLTGGGCDLCMGYDIQMLSSVEKNLPVTTVATSFQFDLSIIMAHQDIKSLADLKGHKILISSSSRATFWPWLVKKYGYTDDMASPYAFNLQPFIHDPSLSVQGYVSSKPFEARKLGVARKVFLLADEGYPPYGSTVITTNGMIAQNPQVVQAFVKATLEGWKSYMHDPAPGNKLIQADNPKMGDDLLGFGVKTLQEIDAVGRGDAKTKGIGTMTDARWKGTYDFLVAGGLLKASTDWKKAFTTQFTEHLHIMMA